MTRRKPNALSALVKPGLIHSLLAGLSLLLLPAAGQAAKFANQFVEFELPPQWQCNLEGAEWVCQSTNEQKKRDAIIVLAAKLKGDQDSLDQYQNYLKSPKTYASIQGKRISSQSKYVKTIGVNHHAWVDSLHSDSEIPGFFTRYLATVKEDIGVLVTYSVNRAKYPQYIRDFETMVKTLRVFRKPGGINTLRPSNSNLGDMAKIPTHLGNEMFPVNPPAAPDSAPARKKDDEFPLLPLLLGGVALIFFMMRKKRGR